jgi:putative FmdB family regulatory protein
VPIFEYKCKKCGHKMEFLEKSRAAEKHVCEQCGSSDLQKLLSGFSVGHSKSSGPDSCDLCSERPCAGDICGSGACPLSQ